MTAVAVLCTVLAVSVGLLLHRRRRRSARSLDWAAHRRPAAMRRWGEIVQPGIDAARKRNDNRGDENRVE
jgi:hypothetical protein